MGTNHWLVSGAMTVVFKVVVICRLKFNRYWCKRPLVLITNTRVNTHPQTHRLSKLHISINNRVYTHFQTLRLGNLQYLCACAVSKRGSAPFPIRRGAQNRLCPFTNAREENEQNPNYAVRNALIATVFAR
jgi:hypothetical protein